MIKEKLIKNKIEKIGISEERKKYLKKIKKEKTLIIITQILIVVGLIAIWEIAANLNLIDSFITSQPSRIVKTFANLTSNDLLKHIGVTCFETIIGFLLGTILGILIAIILWWSKFVAKVAEPFLVVLNSLPKVSLRTDNHNMGRSRNTSNHSNGTNDITNSKRIRNTKWISRNRQRKNQNGTNF